MFSFLFLCLWERAYASACNHYELPLYLWKFLISTIESSSKLDEGNQKYVLRKKEKKQRKKREKKKEIQCFVEIFVCGVEVCKVGQLKCDLFNIIYESRQTSSNRMQRLCDFATDHMAMSAHASSLFLLFLFFFFSHRIMLNNKRHKNNCQIERRRSDRQRWSLAFIAKVA